MRQYLQSQNQAIHEEEAEMAEHGRQHAEQANLNSPSLADQASAKSHELSSRASEAFDLGKNKSYERAEQAKEKGAELESRASAGLESAANKAWSKANQLANSASETAESVSQKAQQLGENIKETFNETREGIKERFADASNWVKSKSASASVSPSAENRSGRPTAGDAYDPIYHEEGSIKDISARAGHQIDTAGSSHKFDQVPVDHVTDSGVGTPLEGGGYERPVPPATVPATIGSGTSAITGMSASERDRQSETAALTGHAAVGTVDSSSINVSAGVPPSLPSQEANLGGYEGIKSRDPLAEGAHLASYVQDMSEL